VKVFLLHRDRDFEPIPELRDRIFEAMFSSNLFAITNVKRDLERERKDIPSAPPTTHEVVAQDLELETLWRAMAAGDDFFYETAKRVVLTSLVEPEEIVYRQRVLADCLEHPEVVRQIYELTIEALESERKAGGGVWQGARPDMILHRSVQVLKLHVDVLKRLRRVAEEQAESFGSEGFTRLFTMLREELADDYLQSVEQHLRELEFKRGVLESAQLGKGNKGRRYLVRKPREQRWTERLSLANRSPSYGFSIPPRDENGFKALDDMRGRGINVVANAVAQSADHVRSFFSMLRLELAFYLGCVNLRDQLDEKGEPTCLPTPVTAERPAFACTELYDVSLALHLEARVVGNDVNGDGTSLVVITGANQGGKSTFLRSVGLAQLMLQSGMFVGAETLSANVCDGVFTHYKREEDATMESGKLDEELRRMSEIADSIRPSSLLLCNESFASTNEREGSEIARQVVRALLEAGVKVLFVTHLYDLAHGFWRQQRDDALFLRAERGGDGRRPFKLVEGEPLPTSFGEDTYRRVFGSDDAATSSAPRRAGTSG
jgi:DNA mismatch repair ATPase MutS